jgi:hypothetical protein
MQVCVLQPARKCQSQHGPVCFQLLALKLQRARLPAAKDKVDTGDTVGQILLLR